MFNIITLSSKSGFKIIYNNFLKECNIYKNVSNHLNPYINYAMEIMALHDKHLDWFCDAQLSPIGVNINGVHHCTTCQDGFCDAQLSPIGVNIVDLIEIRTCFLCNAFCF